MKRKARNIVRDKWFISGDRDRREESQDMMAHNCDNLAMCSCFDCGNPRRKRGEKTLQERRAALDDEEAFS